MIDFMPARTVVQWALDERVFPAASIEVGTATRVLWNEAFGSLSYQADSPKTTGDSVFDLASLTKVIGTGTAAMHLVEHGTLDLDAPVWDWLPMWDGPDRAAVTIRDLLEHASGLPAWLPLHRTCRGPAAFAAAICRTPLSFAARSRSLYSDLGFILLGMVLEAAEGRSLDRLLAEALPDSAVGGAFPLVFLPPASWRDRTAPTRLEDERGPMSPGDVDDTNAWALGGVAGHSGLFGSASAVGGFARADMRTLGGAGPSAGGVAQPATLRRFLARSAVSGSSRALAWDTMLPTSSCGTRMSASAFGHTGFTGTSLWVDPEQNLYLALLTNRVHPTATGNETIQAVRRAFHDAVIEAVAVL